jgi:hypothetical protein
VFTWINQSKHEPQTIVELLDNKGNLVGGFIVIPDEKTSLDFAFATFLSPEQTHQDWKQRRALDSETTKAFRNKLLEARA